MQKIGKFGFSEIGVSLFVLAVIALPFFGFARGGDKIYVNEDTSGTQNGSSSHPYKTIWQGLDKAHDGDEVIVAKGTYKERITLPKGVKLSGAGKGKTIIKSSERSDDPVINMKDGSKVWGITVKDGEVGIYVRQGAKVDIIDSDIRENRHEGIIIENGERTDKEKVSIVNCEVKDNGWSGIYSKKRKVVIMESGIKNNGRNGVVFESGVRAWIDNNSISENKGSGLVMNLDGADVTIASKNTFRKNGREGVEVSSFGMTGSLDVRKSRLSENGRYGVARISKIANISPSVWSGLVVEGNNTFFGNGLGDVSSLVRGF